MLLNILAVPILIAQAPQGGTWYFSSRLITLWNVFFVASIILAFLRTHLFLFQSPSPLPVQGVLLIMGSIFVYALLLVFPLLRLPEIATTGIVQEGTQGLTHRIASPNTIFYASNRFIWIGTPKGRVLGPILIYTPHQKEPFKVFPEGIFDPEQNALRILQTGEHIPLSDRISTHRPFVLSTLWIHLQHFTQRITPQYPLDLRAILFIFTFVFLLTSLFSLLHLTRWLLFNALLVLSIPFLTFTGIAFLDELGQIPSLAYAPAILHGGIAILCFGLQFFLRPSTKR